MIRSFLFLLLAVLPLTGCVSGAADRMAAAASGERITAPPLDPKKLPRDAFEDGVRWETQLQLGSPDWQYWTGNASHIGVSRVPTTSRRHYIYGASSLLARLEDYCKARGFYWDAEPGDNIAWIAMNYTDIHKMAHRGSMNIEAFRSVNVRVCHDVFGDKGVDFIVYYARQDSAFVATGRDGFGNVQGYGGQQATFFEFHEVPMENRPWDLDRTLRLISCDVKPDCAKPDARPTALGAAYAWARMKGLPGCRIAGRLDGTATRANAVTGETSTISTPENTGMAIWQCFAQRGGIYMQRALGN